MSEYYTVDVKDVASSQPRSSFDVGELDRLARSIIAAGGLLSPLILKETGVESYEVIAGDFEYYASVRAQEISPDTMEVVNAFIVPDELAEDAIKQFMMLHRPSSEKVHTKQSRNSGEHTANMEARIGEAISDFRDILRQNMQSIGGRFDSLQEQLPSKVEPLEAFNKDSVEELIQKLAKANVKGKTAKKIIESVEKERKNQAFVSLKDVVDRVTGLGSQGMLTLLDKWGGLY